MAKVSQVFAAVPEAVELAAAAPAVAAWLVELVGFLPASAQAAV